MMSLHSDVIRLKLVVLVLVVLPAALLLYARTAAPSVLSGDSGEFQFAAPLLAIPHPTGYPLYILLGKLATFLPVGDIAYRVTLVAALAGAATVTLLGLLVLRCTASLLAALVSAVALAVAPGFWHLATIAEVYTLNTLLLALLAVCLVGGHVGAAALVTGLGCTNHGSFAFTGVPLFLAFGVMPLLWNILYRPSSTVYRPWSILIGMGVAGLVGLAPWLLLVVHYMRFGPFTGIDHGLPTAYFWGAPVSWGEVFDHMLGGVLRDGVFDLPGPYRLYGIMLTLWDRLQFEFGPLGVMLGIVGGVSLLRRSRWIWLASAWVAGITLLYFASLGSAVQDAMVFTLPLLLVWAFWVGIGTAALAERVTDLMNQWYPLSASSHPRLLAPVHLIARSIAALCLAGTLVWGSTRLPYGNKANQWLFREFGEGVMAQVAPHAAIMVRWEQGTILQYLHLVEGQRPDVWIDMVEPQDEAWQKRAARRYAGQPVYIIGNSQDGAELGARYVWGTDYADLFELLPQK